MLYYREEFEDLAPIYQKRDHIHLNSAFVFRERRVYSVKTWQVIIEQYNENTQGNT